MDDRNVGEAGELNLAEPQTLSWHVLLAALLFTMDRKRYHGDGACEISSVSQVL